MKQLFTYLLAGLLLLSGPAFAQIFAPEGLNLPGQWNRWQNPPAAGSAFGSETQVAGGGVKLITTGTRRWQATLHIAATGGDTTAGTYDFLFTSGPTGNPYQNKWAGVNVTINTLQNYTLGSDTDNRVTLENDRYYTVNWRDAGYQGTSAIFMATGGLPVSIDTVTANPSTLYVDENTPVNVTAHLSGPPSEGERIFLRYTNDNFATSHIIEMTVDGDSAMAQLPAAPAGEQIVYYVFSSSVSNPAGNYDMLTICSNTNNGLNYSYLTGQEPMELELGPDRILCPGSTTELSPGGAAYDSFLWSTGETDSSITVSEAGTYWIRVSKDSREASDTIRISLDETPGFSLGNDTLICGVSPVTLDAGIRLSPDGDKLTVIYDATQGQSELQGETSVYFHSTYELVPFGGPVSPWTGNWGQDNGLGLMTPLGNNRWSITITLQEYYGYAPETAINGLFMVFRNADGSKTGKTAAGNDIFLNLAGSAPTSSFSGITATRERSPYNSFLWSTGDTTATIAVEQSGSYWLTATTAAGCVLTDTIEITFSPVPELDLGPDTTFCGPFELILDAGPGFETYHWSTGDTGRTVTIGSYGTIAAYATTADGCIRSDTIHIGLDETPGFSLGNDTLICGAGPLTLDAGIRLSPDGDKLTVIYDATQGQSELQGETSVYFHSTYELVPFGGPVSPWTGNWDQDDGLGLMTPLGNNRWSITITLQEYYGYAPETAINGLFMVFRNADGSKTGKTAAGNDIFLNLAGSAPTSSFSGITATRERSPYNSFLWSTGDTTATIAVEQSGSYWLSATTAAGCMLADTIDVTFSPVPELDLGPDTTFCGPFELVLDAGAGFGAYSWSTGDTTQAVTVDSSGTFTVVASTGAGCTLTDSIRVSSFIIPENISLGPDRAICGTDLLFLDPEVSVSPAGDSLTIVYDATKGQSQLLGVDTVYFHSSFEYEPFGGAESPWVGNWGQNSGPGLMTPLGNNRWTITIKPYDYYNIDPNRSINGLFMVFRNADGSKTGKNAAGNDIFLNVSQPVPSSTFDGITATRFGSVFSGILWSTGATSPGILVDQPGTYSVILFGPGGCNAYDTISVSSSPHPVVNLGPDKVLCSGSDTVTLDAGPGFSTYSWIGGSQERSIRVGDPGFYIVMVTNAAGCSAYGSITVTRLSQPMVTFTTTVDSSNSLTIHFTVTSSGGSGTYQWDFDNNGTVDNTTAGDVSYTYPAPGNYTAKLHVENTCGSFTVTQTLVITGVGLDDRTTGDQMWKIYPNPARDFVTIAATGKQNEPALVTVYSSTGQLLLQRQLNSPEPLRLDTGTWPAGLYLLNIATRTGNRIKRIVKE